MLITPAFAQAASSAPAAPGFGSMFVLMVPLLVVWYFLLIRPQQRRAQEQAALIKSARRGDQIVTVGGILGKVTKANEDSPEVEVEIADGIKVKILRTAIAEIRNSAGATK